MTNMSSCPDLLTSDAQAAEPMGPLWGFSIASLLYFPAAIPAHSHGTAVPHVSRMIYKGVAPAYCLKSGHITLTRRRTMGGYKQGYGGLWTDEAAQRAPGVGRETSEAPVESRGVGVHERSMPLIAMPEGCPQFVHGLEGIAIEQRPHALPQQALTAQFGPDGLE
jgi:hypothetical protein